MKRMRGRNHRSGGGGGGGFRNQQNGIPLNRNHVFDSSGPEMRVRGTAQQLYDKYSQLARDAASSNDRVLGEAYYQHAEHYFRILSAINAAQGLPPPSQGGEQRYQAQGEYQRREHSHDGDAPEGRESRHEMRPDQARHENREFRENRQGENREFRENRQGENRQERRFEPRHNNRQDFQQRERQDRQDRPYRSAPPIADTPIDISSALEAELRAAASEAAAGLDERPSTVPDATTAEPRAIPIRPEAPPMTPELTLTEPANPAPRRRGRPPRAKAEDTTKTE
ncbi:DUF4167 domain-containing protein [Acidocella sp.]|uniref:DUF4167 domain-containing protein n=1 Tax=Acidocella sp. TaxID=50710 RepID=UPI0038CFAE35